ncbi:MAG: outer membrane lipoprotein carrier protein LolA [Desulfobacterales bacterium]|jgi:outer membrane lipoprotein carrier protein|nr:outer membrane lipoprotein carrier protein LolA [Desulfobacterales bacterium]
MNGFTLRVLMGMLAVLGVAPALLAQSMPSLDTVLREVEKRYTAAQFSAEFLQESTIRAMEITDFASGRIYVRYPGMMRWEYEKPEPQAIITDGTKLWVYRPQDNQVLTGSAPVFFRDGKGASFLSDIRLVRQKFTITLHPPEGENLYELRLVPRESTLNISQVRLLITPRTYTIARIVTLNDYGDDTRIDIINTQFSVELNPALFSFEIPPGADVQRIEE